MSSLLPPNATPQERALDETTARLADVPVEIRSVWNPETCPAQLLPWLAWAFSLDEWDSTWSAAQQRSAIQAGLQVQKRKGTIGAVTRALAALGFNVRLQEWFNQIPAADPYTYLLLLEVDQIGYSQADLQKLLAVVESTKNLRSHLTAVVPKVVTSTEVFAASVAVSGNEICYSAPAGLLQLDGTWTLNGAQKLNGVKV